MESLRDSEIKKLLSGSRQDIHLALSRFSERILRFYGQEVEDAESLAHFLHLSVSGLVQKKIVDLVDIDVEQVWEDVCQTVIQGLGRK